MTLVPDSIMMSFPTHSVWCHQCNRWEHFSAQDKIFYSRFSNLEWENECSLSTGVSTSPFSYPLQYGRGKGQQQQFSAILFPLSPSYIYIYIYHHWNTWLAVFYLDFYIPTENTLWMFSLFFLSYQALRRSPLPNPVLDELESRNEGSMEKRTWESIPIICFPQSGSSRIDL